MDQVASQKPNKTHYVLKLWGHLQGRISMVMAEETTFEEVTRFMSDSKNIKLTASFYTMLASFCNKTPIEQSGSSSNTKKARLILSALMIVKFPSDVMDVADISELDPASEDCYKAASDLIRCLVRNEKAINAESIHKLHCDEALQFMNVFMDKFNLWKNHDFEKVLESVKDYYAQWMRSYKLLQKSGMNEERKKIVLNTLVENMNRTQAKIAKLVGNKRAKKICQDLKDQINAEPDPEIQPRSVPLSQQQTASQTASGYNSASSMNDTEYDDEEKKEDMNQDTNQQPQSAQTLEQKLAAKGVPMNIRSGRNLVRDLPKSTNPKNNDSNQDENGDAKYLEDVDGQKVLNLDKIIMEEASRNYWAEFSRQIENNSYSRLFDLLTELLERLKKLSPHKEHKHLDDLMDVEFIQQTISNGSIDANAFYGIFVGIWNQIKSLHAPSEDKSWQKWHDEIVGEFGSDNATWGTLLSQVFNMFLLKMDRIEDQVKAIHEVTAKRKGSNEKKQ